MTRHILLLAAFAVAGLPMSLLAQDQESSSRRARKAYPPQLAEATSHVYKQADDVELRLWLYAPDGHDPSDKRAAIVFFFGGGWRSGSPQQFAPHCEYLADRGMVAITADYRVASRHKVKATACVADARSAVRWVRENATKLGIDPERIAAGGGSAGGHLAACTGVIDEPASDRATDKVSSRPDALVLFNPALVLADFKDREFEATKSADLEERIGQEPKTISPIHHVGADEPPTIIFHGKADTTVPYWTAEAFADEMQRCGNRCELVGFKGETHGFFNFGRGDNHAFQATTKAMDEFLVSLGFLSPR